ncbi:MAG: carboxypeptidase regulatory-like domain-containing protein [Armatimonadota bacterium]
MIRLILSAIILCVLSSSAVALALDGFVQVKGNQFVLSSDRNSIIKVKGFNYYPQNAPWEIWDKWDKIAIDKELEIASGLGANVIRTFLDFSDHPGEENLQKIKQFTDICKAKGIKVMFTFFDGVNTYPAEGTEEEKKHFAMIDAVCNMLKDETAVFGWDIKNEPDNICNEVLWNWKLEGAESCAELRIGWLRRMAEHIKKVDPNHLVTVGLAISTANFEPEEINDIASFCDFLCFHYYLWTYHDQDLPDVIDYMHKNTNKPVVVQEIGNNPANIPGNTEYEQAIRFKYWLDVIEETDAAGIIQWVLPEWTLEWPGDDDERYYGFLKADGKYTIRPAGYVYRDNFPVRQFFFSDKHSILSGKVRDVDNNPISDVSVYLVPGFYNARTAQDGSFAITAIPSGKYELIANKNLYNNTHVKDIELKGDDCTRQDITLTAYTSFPNSVVNPDFELGNMRGWKLWGRVDGVFQAPWHKNLTPQSGKYFLGIPSNYAVKSGGVYQTISAEIGKEYEASVYIYTYDEGDSDGSSVCRIGIDPMGMDSYKSNSIIWSDYTSSQGKWSQIKIKTTAKSNRLTLLLDYKQPQGGTWHINCFDSVEFKMIE